jgi:hypothetical protein
LFSELKSDCNSANLTKTGKTTNNKAPMLVSPVKTPQPTRSIRSIYIQKSHHRILDKLIFEQKMDGGKKTPELMEEAIELIAKKYSCN